MEKYKEDFIEFLLKQNSLKFGDFTLKSKRSSPYFINVGDLNDGLGISKLGEAFAQVILSLNEQPDVLFGPSYKGIPLAVATSIAMSSKGKNIGQKDGNCQKCCGNFVMYSNSKNGCRDWVSGNDEFYRR